MAFGMPVRFSEGARTMFHTKAVLLTGLLVLIGAIHAVAQQGEIDWNRARQLRQRSLRGEKLSEEEQTYLQRAIELRQKESPQRQRPQQRPTAEVKLPVGLKPLTDMTGEDRYKGQEGGLYGGGKNEPPKEHLEAALEQAKKVQPLDAEGKPAKGGKIVVISNGMSNTTQEFSAFVRLAHTDPAKSPNVVIVDGAQGGMEASDWADPRDRFRPDRPRQEKPNPWDVLDRRLQQAGVTPQQVQVVWIKQASRPGATPHLSVNSQDTPRK